MDAAAGDCVRGSWSDSTPWASANSMNQPSRNGDHTAGSGCSATAGADPGRTGAPGSEVPVTARFTAIRTVGAVTRNESPLPRNRAVNAARLSAANMAANTPQDSDGEPDPLCGLSGSS
ncbi:MULTISPECIES: hypothetical protein [Streptomyces]|uniref:hypothetical protein n=1 Tax=Streptomyces TaxID=1883 RepID=UPI001678A14B|nr:MULTISPECIES: hypothetical protein [Streptomyces]MBK3526176.1 hypothetical protein [Streptomyces sp. MBT70]